MADGSYNQKDHSKMAARRMKTELLVDENLGRTSGNSNHQPSGNKYILKFRNTELLYEDVGFMFRNQKNVKNRL